MLIKKLMRMINKIQTIYLVTFFVLLGFLPLAIIVIFADNIKYPLNIILVDLMCFFPALSSIPIIARKELPGLITIKGRFAQICGVIYALFFVSIIFYLTFTEIK